MISFGDVLQSVADTIRAVFPDMEETVHIERIENLRTPAVSVEVINIKTPAFGATAVENKINLDIIYFSEDDSVWAAINAGELLSRAFRVGLKVKDRYIHTTEEPEIKLVDQDLHFIVEFSYLQGDTPWIRTKTGGLAEIDPAVTDVENTIGEIEKEKTKEKDMEEQEREVLTDKVEMMKELYFEVKEG